MTNDDDYERFKENYKRLQMENRVSVKFPAIVVWVIVIGLWFMGIIIDRGRYSTWFDIAAAFLAILAILFTLVFVIEIWINARRKSNDKAKK